MSVARSPDGKAAVGSAYSCAAVHPPRLPDLKYRGTGEKHQEMINCDEIKRGPPSEWPWHGVPASGHPPMIFRPAQVHSPTGSPPLFLEDWAVGQWAYLTHPVRQEDYATANPWSS